VAVWVRARCHCHCHWLPEQLVALCLGLARSWLPPSLLLMLLRRESHVCDRLSPSAAERASHCPWAS